MWLEALDGNNSDKHSFPATVDAYCGQLVAGEMPWFVLDSAAYTADNIAHWGTTTRWISCVPQTIKAAQQAIRAVETRKMRPLSEGYRIQPMVNHYGGVAQRWLVVYSEQAWHREVKTLAKKVAREEEKAHKEVAKLCAAEFACEQDARQAVAKLDKKLPWHTLAATYLPVKKYPRPGRPTKGMEQIIVSWQVQVICHLQTDLITEQTQWLGRFILATNELDADRLPDEKVFNGYKAQGKTVERGFRFLKDPMFFAEALFLKSPARIMAMIMVMALCLLVYALAERQVRRQLVALDQTIPDQKGKPTQKPTMRRIAQMFEGVDILIIRQGGQVVDRRVLKLTPVRLQIICLFGPAIQNCYLVGI
jgi:transposase